MSFYTVEPKKYYPKRFAALSNDMSYNDCLKIISGSKHSAWADNLTKEPYKSVYDDDWTFFPLTFEILDKQFSINYRLKSLYEEILESKKFLEFNDDWDEEDAIGCNKIVYLRAIELLVVYAEHVLKFYDIVFKAPEISLLRDGSIDIEWRCKNRMLLLNVVNSSNFDIHFYGKDKNTTVIKGFLYNLEINKDLSHWMHGLL